MSTTKIIVKNHGPNKSKATYVTFKGLDGVAVNAITPSEGTLMDNVWAIGELDVGGEVSIVIDAVPTGRSISQTVEAVCYSPTKDAKLSNNRITFEVTDGETQEPICEGIGCPMDGGFYAGDIQYPNGQWYRLIVADVSADVYGLQWKTADTDTQDSYEYEDGVTNTDAMIAVGVEDHPAANHCVNYDGGGYADWYMPALDELYTIYQNLGPNEPDCPPNFQSGGPQAFSDELYWSSTQYEPYTGWLQSFIDGSQHEYYNKTDTNHRVRPVRRVPFTP